jgi:cytochrome P450
MADPFPDPFAKEIRDNPYPCYQWLREDRPVYYNPDEGYWAISRYADVLAAARNPADFSSAQGIGPGKVMGQTMLTSDPPRHTRLRTLVSRAFQPGVIESLAPRIEAICNELIDASAEARGTFDLMEDFANPLPIRVIAELMGFDPTRYSDYNRWTQTSVEFLSYPNSAETQRKYAASSREFLRYLYEIGRARLRAPGADLFSSLIQAHVERDALTPQEIAFTCELFLVAGGETTAGLIGNAALALAAHPSQASEVLANPALIPSLIEEAIRYDGPFRADFRTTTRALALHGVEIPKGAKVALLLASANRDPQAFPEPDRFLVTRTPNPHLGFGSGIHYCLGAPLARLETRIAATVLLRRFRALEPRTKRSPEWSDGSPLLRKLNRLPMSFDLY